MKPLTIAVLPLVALAGFLLAVVALPLADDESRARLDALEALAPTHALTFAALCMLPEETAERYRAAASIPSLGVRAVWHFTELRAVYGAEERAWQIGSEFVLCAATVPAWDRLGTPAALEVSR